MRGMKITVGTLFILLFLIGIAFVPASCMSDNTTIDEWMQAHTLKVNVTTTCKYEQEYLLINETYTGEELKARFGIEQFTKELKIPVEAEVLVEGKLHGMQEGEEKVFVTEKVTVLTSADDPPTWWDYYNYPQWAWSKSGDIYEKEDPINLAWKNTTKDTAKSEILEEGWYDWGTYWDFYVYDPILGWINDDNVADDPFGLFGRYHARLWQMSDGDVVANAHHDTPPPHEADELEEAEELVAGYFAEPDDTEWRVYEDSYNLDNNVTSPYSNGWCTQINYGPATWYVPDDYLKIQWAVDTATDGDTIIVRDGTYNENVDVNKRLTIMSENGSASTIVQSVGNIFEVTSDYVNISGFMVEGGAIYLDNVYYCNIANNNASITYSYPCIYLYKSSNNTITNNNVSSTIDYGISSFGILLSYSHNNILTNNTASNCFDGIFLGDSNNNILLNNIFINDGLSVYDSYQNTVEDNTVNGKPLVYLEDTSDIEVADVGQVILVNCDNITVENLDLSNTGIGVELWETDNCKIRNNNISSNLRGIVLYYSNNNILTNNTVLSNIGGISLLWNSNNNSLTNNTIFDNSQGVRLGASNNSLMNNIFINDGLSVYHSYQNTVEDNTVNGKPLVYLEDTSDIEVADAGQVILVNCDNITVENLNLSNTSVGLHLWETDNCKIRNNNISSNNGDGIFLGNSNNNNLSDNTILNNYNGIRLDYSNNNILTSNVMLNNNADGIYLISSNDGILTNNTILNNLAGIYLYRSSNNAITNNNVSSNNIDGIGLQESSNNTLISNIASDNKWGIELKEWSNYNILTKNTASNNYYGISLRSCSVLRPSSNNNTIYLNNFINNIYNVYSSDSTNTWNSTELITYQYNGSTFTNYMGNYWDDYKEIYPSAEEIDGTGIWDNPYSIDSDKDYFPLIGHWKNYFAPTENIFDTGKPANPYPSISGNHTGTITLNQTITVSKLYTYPCPGTGGHTEYAAISYSNRTIIAEAHWNGYVGDWHNISFNKTFTLCENETYKYTIRTGSYPQIHHNRTLLTENGRINCTSFEDTNGKVHTDWMLAITLFLQ